MDCSQLREFDYEELQPCGASPGLFKHTYCAQQRHEVHQDPHKFITNGWQILKLSNELASTPRVTQRRIIYKGNTRTHCLTKTTKLSYVGFYVCEDKACSDLYMQCFSELLYMYYHVRRYSLEILFSLWAIEISRLETVFMDKVGKNIIERNIFKDVIRQIMRSEQNPLSNLLLYIFIVLHCPIY